MSNNILQILQKERKLLQNKRLDLDAAKTRLKKAKAAEARAAVSNISFSKHSKMYLAFYLVLHFNHFESHVTFFSKEYPSTNK